LDDTKREKQERILIAGPCTSDQITRRYGPGNYRVTAYGFEPAGLRWEVLVKDLRS
jgi:hypothetical protein